MSVQAFVSISFQADSPEDVTAFVEGIALPEGAQVSAQSSEQLLSGTVRDGAIQTPEMMAATLVPAGNDEPPAEEPAP